MSKNNGAAVLTSFVIAVFMAGAAPLVAARARQAAPDGLARDDVQPPNGSLPRIIAHAPAGFRLYRAGYRLAGIAVLVSVQLCRLPGWAAPSPARLRVERQDAGGHTSESAQVYLPRLGMRIGDNCSFSSLHLATVPNYGEVLKICAVSGRMSCP